MVRRNPGYTRWEPPADARTDKNAKSLDTRACVSSDEVRYRSDSENRITVMRSLYILGEFRASRSVGRLQTSTKGTARSFRVGRLGRAEVRTMSVQGNGVIEWVHVLLTWMSDDGSPGRAWSNIHHASSNRRCASLLAEIFGETWTAIGSVVICIKRGARQGSST
jgi:hypothetical protein